uniref:Uncharacterized protein n=1 Tax=Anguilla anguilla TaxID=7936 RepID=A0A0E9S099_ANGAN
MLMSEIPSFASEYIHTHIYIYIFFYRTRGYLNI